MSPARRPTASSRPGVTIRRIVDRYRDGYRALRLRALNTDPMAFGSTWLRESQYDEALWTKRTHEAATSSEEASWLAETLDGELVGMAGVFWGKKAFEVWGVCVDPRYRGTGIGGRLLDELLRWTAMVHPEVTVRLSVNPTQTAAVNLYRARGFRPTGQEEPLGHTPGAVVAEWVQLGARSRSIWRKRPSGRKRSAGGIGPPIAGVTELLLQEFDIRSGPGPSGCALLSPFGP
jgi:ribosomal protein S18 acetylase RimI-like enzyme